MIHASSGISNTNQGGKFGLIIKKMETFLGESKSDNGNSNLIYHLRPNDIVGPIPIRIKSSNLLLFVFHSAADHFRSKDYETSAEMFGKSMLYVPYDIENRVLRAKGFRVLCLCHLGLSQLDRAHEYINEAEKVT